MARKTILVSEADGGQRLDRWLKKLLPQVPYAAVQKWLRTGDVRVDGKRARADWRVEAGAEVSLPPMAAPRSVSRDSLNYTLTNADKKMLEQAIVYEDKQLLVLNKPAGLAAQAGGGQTRSLDRIVGAMFPTRPPKLVHRLDRDTTGLIVLAKNRTTAAALMAQFQGREVRKEYLLVCAGSPPAQSGVVDQPLLKRGPVAVASPQGDPAQTRWKILKKLDDNLYLLCAEPLTGRMNQIRAHMAHIGLPLAGDGKYGNAAAREAGAGKLYLHAWKIAFSHPATGEPCRFEAPVPLHFLALTAKAGHESLTP